MTPMIPRNTTIPTQEEGDLLDGDRQPAVGRDTWSAGRAAEARDNRTLGKFHLDGIPPAPRGVPKIEVTFDIDANGILNVHAKDKATGKEQKITITASSGLTEAEIQNDGEGRRGATRPRTRSARRRSRRATSSTRSSSRWRRWSTRTATRSTRPLAAEVERGIENAKKVLEANKDAGKDAAPFKTAFNELQQASYKMAEQMYKTAAPARAAALARAATAARRRRRGRRPRSRRTSSTPSSRSSRSSSCQRSASAISYGSNQKGRAIRLFLRSNRRAAFTAATQAPGIAWTATLVRKVRGRAAHGENHTAWRRSC